MEYPKRLLPTESVHNNINPCHDCYFARRLNIEVDSIDEIYDEDGKIETYFLGRIFEFESSVNLYYCKDKSHSGRGITKTNDVLFSSKKKEHWLTKYTPSIQYQVPNTDNWKLNIDFDYNRNDQIFFLNKYGVENHKGEYPYPQKGNNPPKDFTYTLKLDYSPNLVNVFHYNIKIYGTHIHEQSPTLIKKGKGKGYKSKILNDLIANFDYTEYVIHESKISKL